MNTPVSTGPRRPAVEGLRPDSTSDERLRSLHRISSLLATLESAEETLPAVFSTLEQVLPISSARVIYEEQGHVRSLRWRDPARRAAPRALSAAHVRAAYRYLTGLRLREPRRQPGAQREARQPASIGEFHVPAAPRDAWTLVALPLVADRGRIFGALQLQGDASLGEMDLLFANLVVMQVALALDRRAALDAAAAALGRAAAERRSLDERGRSDEQLRKDTNRLTLMRDALAVVSHDLKNPLNALLLGTAALLEKAPPHDRRQSRIVLDQMQECAQRMGRLVDDLFTLSSVESGHLDVHPVPRPASLLLLEAVVSQGLAARAKGVELVLDSHLDGDTVQVRCDRDRIMQVLSNLIGNAIKFTPRGGLIRLSARSGKRHLRVRVVDAGPGIAERDRAHVFEPYFRGAQPQGPGRGLGLHICKVIVEAHGGRIRVEGGEGRPSSISFTLPLA